jgi:hypothetical protein
VKLAAQRAKIGNFEIERSPEHLGYARSQRVGRIEFSLDLNHLTDVV